MTVVILNVTIVAGANGIAAWCDWQSGYTTVMDPILALLDAVDAPHKRPACDD